MKINTEQELTNLEGEVIKDGANNATVGKLIRNALLAADEKDNADKKLKKYKLAMDCLSTEAELSAEDVSLIKKCVGDNYPPLIVGRVFDIVDP